MRFRNFACFASAFSNDLDLCLGTASTTCGLRLAALVVYIGGSRAIRLPRRGFAPSSSRTSRWEFGGISQERARNAATRNLPSNSSPRLWAVGFTHLAQSPSPPRRGGEGL